MIIHKAVILLSSVSMALAQVTVYGQIPLGQTQSTAAFQTTTVRAAYNSSTLSVPVVDAAPGTLVTNYALQLTQAAAQVPGISIEHKGASFYGFSIEMSVVNQILGKNSSYLNVPFLNLLANLEERAGSVVVRLGGNTQEYATYVEPDDPRLEPGLSYGKFNGTSGGTTLTPSVIYSREMFYFCREISKMVNVNWFMGIPFDDPVNWRLQIVEHGQEILGDRLIGMQAGNEPDFYVRFQRRNSSYSPQVYHDEVGSLISTLATNDHVPHKNILIAPSTSGQNDGFHFEDVVATGFLDTYANQMYGITVEYYPHDNCVAMYGGDPANLKIPSEMLPYYLNHQNVVDVVSAYHNTGMIAQQYKKPLMMFETNTASCGGFPGISNSFTAAMWGLDYGFQLAHSNFTHAMLHVGGQNVFYNPFTAPPTEQAAFNQWTVGPIFYSTLIMAEAFGQSNTSQVIDLNANEASQATPAYAIYTNGQLSKVALFNYLSDDTGAHDAIVALTLPNLPTSVRVKYLLADSITAKDNITWAGQTFGNQLTADGRLRGDLNVSTVACTPAENVCRIRVPAPGFALVLFDEADAAASVSQASATFATTAHMKSHNTATVDQKALATSNGHSGAQRDEVMGGTSLGFRNRSAAADRARARRSAVGVGAALLGVVFAGQVLL